MKKGLTNTICESKLTHPFDKMETFFYTNTIKISNSKLKEIISDYTNKNLSSLTKESKEIYIEIIIKNCERELIELGYTKTKNNFIHPNANFLERFYYTFF